MKRILLGIYLSMFSVACFSQVIFRIEEPASISNTYTFTWSDDPASWGSPDLLDPLNAVTDTLMFAKDSTASDTLACNPLISDLTGKIAVLYRGTCQFGTKSLNAQNAGAVAVIIINNVPGGAVGMAGGVDGISVTIPVVMLSDADGALIRARMDAGDDVIAFIGNKAGMFADDIGFFGDDINRPKAFSNPVAISQDNTEYDVQPGAWVHNYGTNNQVSTVNAKISDKVGNILYDQTAASTTINSGDSAFYSLPTFSQTTYTDEYYTLVYSAVIIDTNITDSDNGDNSISQNFMISDSLFSMSSLADSSREPANGPFYRSSTATTSYKACIHFMDPNASRMAAMGMTFSAWSNDTTNGLNGEYISIYGYEWADVFTDIDDPNFALSTLNLFGVGEYTYSANLERENIYVPFSDPMTLNDNTRYLFCVETYSESIYFGFDNNLDYTQNFNTLYKQPISPIESDGQWFAGGFGREVVPGLSVKVSTNLSAEDIVDDNIKITPYPNPAINNITIPFGEITENGSLEIFDLSGKLISSQNINASTGALIVDVSNITNGNYLFNINFEDGKTSKFNVVITK